DEKLIAVLRAMEISIETPQSRAALARQAGISLRQLERLFPRNIGHGVHFHYRWLRLERARQLLRETTLPVLDVALATGFASASQFARAYARAFGEPPSRTRLRGSATSAPNWAVMPGPKCRASRFSREKRRGWPGQARPSRGTMLRISHSGLKSRHVDPQTFVQGTASEDQRAPSRILHHKRNQARQLRHGLQCPDHRRTPARSFDRPPS